MSANYGDTYRKWNWPFLNRWTKSMIGDYRASVGKAAAKLNNGKSEFTCEDFALHLVIQFAWRNNLPFSIQNGAYGEYFPLSMIGPTAWPGCESHKYYLSYLREVRATTGAWDLHDLRNTSIHADSKNMTEFRKLLGQAQVGDLLFFKYESGRWNHVQVITEVAKTASGGVAVKIFQGNMHDPTGLNSDDPADDSWLTGDYVGVPIQPGRYDDKGAYERLDKGTTDHDIFMNGNKRFYKYISLRRWQFDDWNSRQDDVAAQMSVLGGMKVGSTSKQGIGKTYRGKAKRQRTITILRRM